MGYFFYKGMKDLAKKPTANQTAYMELVAQIKRKFKNISKRGYVPLDNVYKDETPKRVLQKHLTNLKNVVENIYQFAKYYDPLKDSYIIGTERRKQERAEASRKGWETRRANEAKRRAEEILAKQLEQARQEEQERRELEDMLESAEEPSDSDYQEEQWYKDYQEQLKRNIEQQEREYARQQAEGEFHLPREIDQVLSMIEDLVNHWDESITWSESLKSVKRVDKETLKNILDGAIQSLGREQVAMNCLEHQDDLMDIVNRVLYESGDKYKQYGIDSGRTGVQRDLNKFRELLYGRSLTVDESREISEMMERFNEGI